MGPASPWSCESGQSASTGLPPLPGGLRGKRSVAQLTGLKLSPLSLAKRGWETVPASSRAPGEFTSGGDAQALGLGLPCPACPAGGHTQGPRQRPRPPTPWLSRACPRWGPGSSGAGATGASAGWRTSGNPLRGCTGRPGSPPDWAAA